jgi:hypothetical protein
MRYGPRRTRPNTEVLGVQCDNALSQAGSKTNSSRPCKREAVSAGHRASSSLYEPAAKRAGQELAPRRPSATRQHEYKTSPFHRRGRGGDRSVLLDIPSGRDRRVVCPKGGRYAGLADYRTNETNPAFCGSSNTFASIGERMLRPPRHPRRTCRCTKRGRVLP